jgi:hypothetical protein
LLVAACTSGGDGSGQVPSPTGEWSPAPSASPTPLPLKPPLAGLLDRTGPPPAAYVSVMGGFVANVYWRDIQPTAGAPIAAGNAIDQAIAALHRLDPSGRLGIKVRLFAGIYAPEWAKRLDGEPVPIVDPVTRTAGTIGRFWTDAFGSAYDDLQTKLAAAYDSAPEIREITISRCMTAFAEPFIRDTASLETVRNLLGADFTLAADHRCHEQEILSHVVWKQTRSDLSFNPYQLVGVSGGTDESFTEQMMSFCRSTLGARCVLANNSLRSPIPPPYLLMYDRIQLLGPPIAFQTATLSKVGNLAATIDSAITFGAGSVELPGGFQSVSLAMLSSFNSRLRANATTT